MLLVIAFGATACFAHTSEQNNIIELVNPTLGVIYSKYKNYHENLSAYATRQGFQRPIENLATVIHEIIHIDSFAHQGFFVDGIYYEPYLSADAWPSLSNKQLSPYLSDAEKQTSIYWLYVLQAPSNHLGNVVDEINAYGHVLPIVCSAEPQSADKQIKNLIGFLQLSEGYLRTLRIQLPAEYTKLSRHGATRGVFTLIVQRAWVALNSCAVPTPSIPADEAHRLLALP